MSEKHAPQGLYPIGLNGLAVGTYYYDFIIEQQLFDGFGNSEIKGAKIDAAIELIKKPNVTEVKINLKGNITLVCDRCLGVFDYKLALNETAIVKEASKKQDNAINIIIFVPEKGTIELDQYFYDMIMTALPMQRTHERIEDCDQDMIKRLEEYKKQSDDIDPRWNDLKNLI